ncbi:sugar phosphate isomerase/epimerase family protein [Paenibacillus phytorum]|uniref:sugar phosphate isomerase/epimerase family protein n=1 Tax=Paenibacillus phytorum TaxID=2654977 RepID=UPI001C10E0B3|nr:sugar phosphate isomerase/epimerase [Paenibacillus phytorum]
MELKLIKSTWGMQGSYEELFKQIADAGYAGVETNLPNTQQEPLFKELLSKYKLDFIAQIQTVENHSETFHELVTRAATFNPKLIVSQSARDCMGWTEQLKFFEQAIVVEKEAGIPVAHETHRHRAMFTPWTTAALLREFSELKITADFSHWCCVCESLLEDQVESLEIAMKRAIHVHARVGFAQGPQVPHPGAPEYAHELAAHEDWWRQIVKYLSSQGAETVTMTTEFGPPGYMPTLPFTNQPVTDLWDICLLMSQRLQTKFPTWVNFDCAADEMDCAVSGGGLYKDV